MIGFLDGLAGWLAARSAGSWTPGPAPPTGVWPIFTDTMPPAPDQAICLYLYGGTAMDLSGPWAEPQLQLKVRGGTNPRTSQTKACELLDLLHGLSYVQLSAAWWLTDCQAQASAPTPLGPDGNGRHEHTINFGLSVDWPTTHRITT